MATEATTTKNVVHSPLLRFRIKAHCNMCPLSDACKSDKTIEIRCILALIADNQHLNTQSKTIRGTHP